jgi:hypothetical protein
MWGCTTAPPSGVYGPNHEHVGQQATNDHCVREFRLRDGTAGATPNVCGHVDVKRSWKRSGTGAVSCQMLFVHWYLTLAYAHIVFVPRITFSGHVKRSTRARWGAIFASGQSER